MHPDAHRPQSEQKFAGCVLDAEEPAERPEDVEKRPARSARDVVRTSRASGAGGAGRGQVRVDDIGDVGEVARLESVAVHRRRPSRAGRLS